jgi:hypothetical protein
MLVTTHVLVGICCGVVDGIVALFMIFSMVVEMILFIDSAVHKFRIRMHLQASEFLFQLILIRDGSFLLPSNMTRDEIDDIITYLCTC